MSVWNFPHDGLHWAKSNCRRTKTRHVQKLCNKHHEWSLYVSYLILARISNPFGPVWNFPQRWIPAETSNPICAKQRHEMKPSTKHPKWSSHAPQLTLACILNSSESVWNYKLYSHEIDAWNETKCQTPRIESICIQAQFTVHFESACVGVKCSSTMSSEWNYKLHSYQIEERNETEGRTPRLEFICALTNFGMRLESVWVGVELSSVTCSVRQYKLHVYKIRARNETKSQHP